MCSFEITKAQINVKNHLHIPRIQHEKNDAFQLVDKLSLNLQRSIEISSEKGASTWLTTHSLDDRGFVLNKSAFRDALCLRYDWLPQQFPSRCVCDQKFSLEHALSCSRGGFPSIRHNEIRHITADLLTEVCHGVGTDPCLQPIITDEVISYKTANDEDGTRLDIVAESCWGRD